MLLRASLILAAVLACLPAGAQHPLPPAEAYAGSEACRSCHGQKHEDWGRTFHSAVVQDARQRPEAVLGDFVAGVEGLRANEVDYVVGGHWTQRYLRRIGGELYAVPQSWSVASHRWETEDRWSWSRKPYHEYCVGCHTTRYDPSDRSFVEHTVGCEACHGPGRAHAQSGDPRAIVNPARLSQDDQDLLCASCHVRGTDPSGRYQFAVGYVPGYPLEEHYVPHKTRDDEDARSALLRLFREWRGRLERGEPPSCDVCGVTRPAPAHEPKRAAANCRTCHEFDAAYAAHTRHPEGVPLDCLDCHRPPEQDRTAARDVHAPEYFLVHGEAAGTLTPVAACQQCHPGQSLNDLSLRVRQWEDPHRPLAD